MIRFIQLFALLSTLALLSACGSEDSSSSSQAQSVPGQTGTKSVSLSWIAPSTRADGSVLPLNDLSGYRVYMGTTNTSLVPVLELGDSDVTEHSISNLESGSYYFAITALDKDGLESGLSQVVVKQAS